MKRKHRESGRCKASHEPGKSPQKALPAVLPEPAEEVEEQSTTGGEGFRVILFNDEVHTMEQVVVQVMIAVGCDAETASHIMLKAHANGHATVTITTKPDAERIAGVLREIALRVEVRAAG